MFGAECTWQYYSGWFVGALCVAAAGQVLLVKSAAQRHLQASPGHGSCDMPCGSYHNPVALFDWACLHLPRADFAAGRLVNLGCIESMKGGKKSERMRDCYMGESTNCTTTVPCTACNPVRHGHSCGWELVCARAVSQLLLGKGQLQLP